MAFYSIENAWIIDKEEGGPSFVVIVVFQYQKKRNLSLKRNDDEMHRKNELWKKGAASKHKKKFKESGNPTLFTKADILAIITQQFDVKKQGREQ